MHFTKYANINFYVNHNSLYLLTVLTLNFDFQTDASADLLTCVLLTFIFLDNS